MHSRGFKVVGETDEERQGRGRYQFTRKRPRTPSLIDPLAGTIWDAFKRQKYEHFDPTETLTKAIVQGIVAYVDERVPKEVHDSREEIFKYCGVSHYYGSRRKRRPTLCSPLQ
jgi:hypothetical protein